MNFAVMVLIMTMMNIILVMDHDDFHDDDVDDGDNFYHCVDDCE